MRCLWNLAKTHFGNVLDFFRLDALGSWLRHNLDFLRTFSLRCGWNLAETNFGIVLDFFRLDAIGIWLGNYLNVP